jgi:LPS sulfotransferase NodH
MTVQQKRPARFAIMCRARTGSYLLVDLLNQFSDIVCHGEVFKQTHMEMNNFALQRLSYTVAERDAYPITFIGSIFSLTPNRITGFKVFESHNAVARQYILENSNIRKIILTRNPLDSYISLLRAKQTGEWVKKKIPSDSSRQQNPAVKLRFELNDFTQHVHWITAAEQRYAEAEVFTKQKFFRIGYEEVAQIEPVRKVAEFLEGCDLTASLAPTMEKQISEPLENIVENYEEMKTHLRQNHAEHVGEK